ncbi:MAG: hypothetical protein D6795_15695, partial [Deltaproteobacteria bacterium]
SCPGLPAGGPVDLTYTVPLLQGVSIPLPLSEIIHDPEQKEQFGTCSGAADLGPTFAFALSPETSIGWAEFVPADEETGTPDLVSVTCVSFADETENQLFGLTMLFLAEDYSDGTVLEAISDADPLETGKVQVVGYWWRPIEGRLVLTWKTLTALPATGGEVEILQGSLEEGGLNVGNVSVTLEAPQEAPQSRLR